MKNKAVWAWFVGAVVGATVTGSASDAAAQARQAVAVSAAPAALTASAAPSSARPMEDDTSARRRDRTPMNGASIGVSLGMAGSGQGAYKLTLSNDGESESIDGHIDARSGLYVALPINVGGDGFGWNFTPFLASSSVSHDVKDASGYVTGSEDASLKAYGLYTGPVYNFHVARPLYLGIGAGIKLAYIDNDAFDYAADAYGRIPLTATYYVTDSLALVAETGFGYGVSAFVDKDSVNEDSYKGLKNEPTSLEGLQGLDRDALGFDDLRSTSNDPMFGKAFAWDFSIGVRLP